MKHSLPPGSTKADAARQKMGGMGSAIGDRLKKARQELKLTQEALAEMAGVSKQAISQIERGTTKDPAAATLEPICRKAGISLHWLMNGSGDMLNLNPLFSRRATENFSQSDVTSESQPLILDAVILHEAVSLLLFDLDHGGYRTARSASSLLLSLYQRLLAAGGQLTEEEEREFEEQARSRKEKTSGVKHERGKRSPSKRG